MTYSYIGTAPCGCVLAICADIPGQEKSTAADVHSFIQSGLKIDRVPSEVASNIFGRKPGCLLHKRKAKSQSQQALWGESAQ